jgi:hypothetical protein
VDGSTHGWLLLWSPAQRAHAHNDVFSEAQHMAECNILLCGCMHVAEDHECIRNAARCMVLSMSAYTCCCNFVRTLSSAAHLMQRVAAAAALASLLSRQTAAAGSLCVLQALPPAAVQEATAAQRQLLQAAAAAPPGLQRTKIGKAT